MGENTEQLLRPTPFAPLGLFLARSAHPCGMSAVCLAERDEAAIRPWLTSKNQGLVAVAEQTNAHAGVQLLALLLEHTAKSQLHDG